MKSLLFILIGCISTTTNTYGQWELVSNSIKEVVTVKAIEDTLLASTYSFTSDETVFKSTDLGQSWFLSNSGLENIGIYSFTEGNGIVYASSWHDGIFLSSDYGKSWQNFFSDFSNGGLLLTIKDSTLIIGNNLGIIYRSSDLGLYWEIVDSASYCNSIFSLASDSNKIFAATCKELLVSVDDGISWNPVSSPSTEGLHSLQMQDSTLLATSSFRVFGSWDYGQSLEDINHNLNGNFYKRSLYRYGRYILVGTQHGVYVSADNGTIWNSANEGLKFNEVNAFTAIDNYVFAATNDGVYKIDTSQLLSLKCDSLYMYSQHYNSTCDTCTDGLAVVDPRNGLSPYTFTWNTIPEQHTQLIENLTAGEYICCIEDANGCTGCKRVVIEVQIPTSTNALIEELQFLVFPIPANDELTIRLTDHQNATLNIYTILGHRIISQTIVDQQVTIPISSLQSGMHLLEVTMEQQVGRKMFFKL